MKWLDKLLGRSSGEEFAIARMKQIQAESSFAVQERIHAGNVRRGITGMARDADDAPWEREDRLVSDREILAALEECNAAGVDLT
jgi:hypothetical protein